MRVLHVLWFARFGGIERLVLDLVREQKEELGLQVGVMFGQARGEFLARFEEAGIDCFDAGLTSGYDVSLVKYRCLSEVISRYEIIHFHAFNPLLALSAIRSGKLIVYTVHGGFVPGPKPMLSAAVIERLKAIFLSRFVHFISFNSQFTKDYALQVYGGAHVPGTVIYNGASSTIFRHSGHAAALRNVNRSAFVVGTASRFASFKRIDRLIRAFARVQEGRDMILLLVGSGPLEQVYRSLAADLGIVTKVFFTGYQADVLSYLAAMDVCVFPSQNEPFGIVALESLALGKPTVVFEDGGGIREIVDPLGQDDVVKDEADLSERLAFYYRNQSAIDRGVQLRKARAAEFNISAMAKTFNDVYAKVLSFHTAESLRVAP